MVYKMTFEDVELCLVVMHVGGVHLAEVLSALRSANCRLLSIEEVSND